MKNKKNWIFISVIVVVLLTSWAIYCLYLNAGDNQDDVKLELIKILAEGVILGILGFWLKYLVDEATKKREQLRQDAELRARSEREKKKKLLKIMIDLRNTCKKILKTLVDDTSNKAEEIITLGDDSYQELLDKWKMQDFDDDIDKATALYDDLYKQLKENNSRIDEDKKDLIKQEVEKWNDYYEGKIRALNTNSNNYYSVLWK
ncbi:hypothetical protein [Mucilaginibacter sp. SP1R1]|uniref:hypothetical protein n=1 Tax=Mucilaginibacter sp. SP1R1 TaxID=2723091 RepID=UPI00160769DF|nr:hypothetical protein [Mucilaginibacter sp. SP1R1]MBB6150582.1 vacuolar-type H+-ATPase subunit H [Mucilaginibacter sp. SP1R1]